MGTPLAYRSQPDPYLDSGKLHALQIMLCSRLDEVLNELGVRLYKSTKYYYGACPIHAGNNQGALNLYRKGDVRPGFWVCNTHHCEQTFKRTILGFVRGVLSHQKHNWASKEDPKVSWKDAVDWCCQFLECDIRDIEVDYDELEKIQFASGLSILTKKPEQEVQGVSRAKVRQFLQIPAPYFLKRGWSPEILDRYDVGLYPVKGKPLSERVAVPIYDPEHKVAVGFTGRSIWSQCQSCSRWHGDGPCPTTDEAIRRAAKWWNQGFAKENYLYNLWFSKRNIRESGCVVLCEGPGDIWRLEEAGIHCGVAMFGVKLSDHQQVMLETSGAMNLVVLTDKDEAGEEARRELKQRLGRMFRLHFPLLTKKDIGDMSVEQVKAEVGPTLQAIKDRGY